MAAVIPRLAHAATLDSTEVETNGVFSALVSTCAVTSATHGHEATLIVYVKLYSEHKGKEYHKLQDNYSEAVHQGSQPELVSNGWSHVFGVLECLQERQ